MTVERAESLREAIEWDTTKNQYLRLGLCYRCAVAAAYGHQLGFARVVQPCRLCVTVVAAFPMAAANGWRKVPRALRRSAAAAALSTPQTAGRTWSGSEAHGVVTGPASGPTRALRGATRTRAAVGGGSR